MTGWLRSYLRSLRQNPFGDAFYRVWLIVTLVAHGSVALLISDLGPQLLNAAGLPALGQGWDGAKIYLLAAIALSHWILLSWLALPGFLRSTLWIIASLVTVSLAGDLVFGDMHYDHVLLLVMPVLAALSMMPFLEIRRRPWLPGMITLVCPLLFFAWHSLYAPELDRWADGFLSDTNLHVDDQAFHVGAWLVYSFLIGTALAWLMPPCEKRAETETTAELTN